MIPNKKERGFYLIGILMALAIIMILNGGYFMPGKNGGLSTYDHSMNKTKSMDCDMSRKAFQTNMANWQINNSSTTPTIEQLKNSGITISKCRQGGEYSIGKDGKVYCTLHAEDPASVPPPPEAQTWRPDQPGQKNQQSLRKPRQAPPVSR